jgi:hypothetical protein
MLILLVMSSLSLGGTIDPSVPDSKYRDYGSKFECVVSLKGICCCEKKEDKHIFYASAVVIDPHWILTAAHVVSGAEDVKVSIKGKDYDIKKIIINKDFKEDEIGYHDIALGYCESELVMDFYPKLYEKDDEVSKVVSMAGYGMTGTFSTGYVKSDGIRRAGSNIIERTERNVLVCSNSVGKKTQLEYMIASGDSGGGLFIGNELAGINSFVMATDGKSNSDYGDECAHTRISLYVDWVAENMKIKTE